MLRLLSDENFDNDVIRGLRLRLPELDLVRVQDVGLMGVVDPEILEWAAQNSRILLTHDKETMIGYAYSRLLANKPMPGIFAVEQTAPTGTIIDNLPIIINASSTEEWENRVEYIPL